MISGHAMGTNDMICIDCPLWSVWLDVLKDLCLSVEDFFDARCEMKNAQFSALGS